MPTLNSLFSKLFSGLTSGCDNREKIDLAFVDNVYFALVNVLATCNLRNRTLKVKCFEFV